MEVVLLPEIVLKPKISTFDISPFVDKYRLQLVKRTDLYQIYSVPVDSDVISIANKLYESNEFDFAYPNLFSPVKLHSYIPNDPYFQYQITCHNIGQTINNGHSGTINADINAPEAWDISKGSPNIVVAVFDEGVTSNHPDLPNSRQVRLNGSNFGSGNPNDPSPVGNSNHGNACAGVIAATMDNNEGIAGIAPLCKIMPVREDATSSPNDIADGILFAMNNGAKIISCSIGYSNSGSSPNLYPVITAAIDTAIHHNVVVLFSAGNTADYPYYNGFVEFPANANISNLITVGSSDRYDHVALYSPCSSLIDFVAPSHRAYYLQTPEETFEMWSLDIPGDAGWNPVNFRLDSNAISIGDITPNTGTNHLSYTGYFGGTSHSCPVVAGAVALMLSINPQLKPAEVYNILKNTSAKVGGYTYVEGRCNEMGYGRVDAFAATWATLNMYINGTIFLCDTATYQVHNIPANATVHWSFDTQIQQFGNFPIITISDTHSPTITVQRGSYYINGMDGLPLPPVQYHGWVTLKADVTLNGLTRRITYAIYLRQDVAPTLPASALETIHLNEQRTFTINNCPNATFYEVKWVIRLPQTSTDSIYYGRSWEFTPSQSGTLNMTLYNNDNCDSTSIYTPYSITVSRFLPYDPFDPFLSFPNPVTTGTVDIQVIDKNYSTRGNNDEETAERPDIDYTLELWDNDSRSIRSIKSTIHGEKDIVTLDVNNLRDGIYLLTLKVDDQILTTSKMIIDH